MTKKKHIRLKLSALAAMVMAVCLAFTACSAGTSAGSSASSEVSGAKISGDGVVHENSEESDTEKEGSSETVSAEATPDPGYMWLVEPYLQADSITLIDPYATGEYTMFPAPANDEAEAFTSEDYHNMYLIKNGEKYSVYKVDDSMVTGISDLPSGFEWCDTHGVCNSDMSKMYNPLDMSTSDHGGHGGSYDGIKISIYDSGTDTFYPGEIEQTEGQAYIFKYSSAVSNTDDALIGPEASGDENGFCVIKDGKLISELFPVAKPCSDIVDLEDDYVLPIAIEEGSAWPVQLADGTWTFVNSSGETFGSYEDAKLFHGKYAAVKSGGKWGIIDKEGNQLVDFLFADISSVDNKRAFAKNDDGLWGYIWIEK